MGGEEMGRLGVRVSLAVKVKLNKGTNDNKVVGGAGQRFLSK